MSLNVPLLRKSFEKASRIGPDLVRKFYFYLFRDFPQAKIFFPEDVKPEQQEKLLRALVYIIKRLESPALLTSYLHGLGRLHGELGVQPVHYEWVGESLIRAFSHFFGSEWTEDLDHAWRDALNAVTGLMLEGAALPEGEGAEGDPPPEEAVVEEVSPSGPEAGPAPEEAAVEEVTMSEPEAGPAPEEMAGDEVDPERDGPGAEAPVRLETEQGARVINLSREKTSSGIQLPDDVVRMIHEHARHAVELAVEKELQKALEAQLGELTPESIRALIRKAV